MIYRSAFAALVVSVLFTAGCSKKVAQVTSVSDSAKSTQALLATPTSTAAMAVTKAATPKTATSAAQDDSADDATLMDVRQKTFHENDAADANGNVVESVDQLTPAEAAELETALSILQFEFDQSPEMKNPEKRGAKTAEYEYMKMRTTRRFIREVNATRSGSR